MIFVPSGTTFVLLLGLRHCALDWAIAFNAFQMYEYIVVESK